MLALIVDDRGDVGILFVGASVANSHQQSHASTNLFISGWAGEIAVEASVLTGFTLGMVIDAMYSHRCGTWLPPTGEIAFGFKGPQSRMKQIQWHGAELAPFC